MINHISMSTSSLIDSLLIYLYNVHYCVITKKGISFYKKKITLFQIFQFIIHMSRVMFFLSLFSIFDLSKAPAYSFSLIFSLVKTSCNKNTTVHGYQNRFQVSQTTQWRYIITVLDFYRNTDQINRFIHLLFGMRG